MVDAGSLENDPRRWEGDTLVVESFGFHPGTWLDRDGHPHSERLRLVERYRRPFFGTPEIEVTLTDRSAHPIA